MSRWDNPVYVERSLLKYIRTWPNAEYDPCWITLVSAGVLSMTEQEGELILTDFGSRVKAICDSQSYNFWLLPAFLDPLPVSDLANRTSQADHYVTQILRLDWNSRDVRTYISARMLEGEVPHGCPSTVDRPPSDLLSMIAALGEAFDRLTARLEVTSA